MQKADNNNPGADPFPKGNVTMVLRLNCRHKPATISNYSRGKPRAQVCPIGNRRLQGKNARTRDGHTARPIGNPTRSQAKTQIQTPKQHRVCSAQLSGVLKTRAAIQRKLGLEFESYSNRGRSCVYFHAQSRRSIHPSAHHQPPLLPRSTAAIVLASIARAPPL